MNRNERIAMSAREVMNKINDRKQWKSLTVNGFETHIDVVILGPREIDDIRNRIDRILDEVTAPKK